VKWLFIASSGRWHVYGASVSVVCKDDIFRTEYAGAGGGGGGLRDELGSKKNKSHRFNICENLQAEFRRMLEFR
jgi:hypothetical protein